MASHFAELQSGIEDLGHVSDFVNEFIEAVQPQRLFDEFSRQETTLLSEYLECFGVPRDSAVLREGDEGDFLAILVTGNAVIFKSHEGREMLVHQLKPGEMIGEMSLIDGQRRFASCFTTEPSDIAVLTRENFNNLLADHPRLANKFLMLLLRLNVSRLREATLLNLPGLAPSAV
jgi:CRP/FNR family transcriptional regulator, cyclic AMP receptor protein